MWYGAFFDGRYLGHILRLRSLHVQERHKNTDLNHIHELLIERLIDEIIEIELIVVEDFNLVLFDQK